MIPVPPGKILITVNTAWNLVNFRTPLIKALVERGHEVVAAAPADRHAARLEELGCRFVPLPMDNRGTHPLRDGWLLLRYVWLLMRERPVAVLAFTVKPNIYGGLAARWLGIPVINNITGLGAVFIRGGWLANLVRGLYRAALKRSARVFFQNPDDRDLFVAGGMADPARTELLPGSGVDLAHFTVTPLPEGRRFRFLLIARMLRDKGVGEFVAAARTLRARHPHVEFALLGSLDALNPAAIERSEVEGWVAEGIVTYFGEVDDVRPLIASADCVVLPSYREGTPRTLLEAAAMGRPLVATDVPGCREVVDDDCNGFLCPPRDAGALADAMERMLLLRPERRQAMATYGRCKVEEKFDQCIVVSRYLDAIGAATGGSDVHA